MKSGVLRLLYIADLHGQCRLEYIRMNDLSELLILENFRCAFLPTPLTAPRSPRMTDHTADIYFFIYFFANSLKVDKQTEPNVPY